MRPDDAAPRPETGAAGAGRTVGARAAELPPALVVVVLPRLRLTLAELARRVAEREAVQP